MTSIRRNLLAALLVTVSVVVLISAYATYRQVRLETDEIFDYQLRQLTLSMRDQTFSNGLPSGPSSDVEDFDFVIQVWDREGLKLYVSPSVTVLPNHAQLGFSTVHTAEGDWRVYGAPIRNHIIQVAQPLKIREEIAYTAALRMLLPLLLLLPTLAILIWLLVGYGLSPLNKLALAVKDRTPVSMDRLPEQDVPVEVLPLVQSLNGLLDRLGQALATQRAFVSDAAHGLRSPLTALQLQMQLVERTSDESRRAEFIAELKHGLDRMTHIIHQLLTLARTEPDAIAQSREEVDLVDLLRRTVADLNPLAESRAVDVGVVTTAEQILVAGDSAALRTLMNNLLENAIHYTPVHGKIDLSAGIDTGAPWIEIGDSGPGIPEQERARVFDRFYRGKETSEPGSGLGLAIVKAIADNHGATVGLGQSPLGGLAVHIAFGREKEIGAKTAG
ncbi:sensor protein QseC [mine drainage metagenome]|uniref:histidine kinase n=1 Tax=mine drainage metagenome TaxID=410659 RepID=A0A1J5RAP2_9ZZZZ